MPLTNAERQARHKARKATAAADATRTIDTLSARCATLLGVIRRALAAESWDEAKRELRKGVNDELPI